MKVSKMILRPQKGPQEQFLATKADIFPLSGMMYHLEGADWLHDFEAELLEFPNGIYDDQVDVISYAVYMQSWGYLNVKKRGSRALVLG